ncbi:MAG TPA: helix-turn-helix domain-containing protein [Phycisphaerae bacterium]|nr:helix-turn-helix domain-containing protein [Phycisphaerae bacterium]
MENVGVDFKKDDDGMTPMGRQSNLTLEQRTEAVLSLLRREESGVKIARRYGISEPTLYRYRDIFLDAGKAGLAHGNGQADPARREVAELRKQLAQRDQVIGEITIANRIFKKLSGECP